MRYSILTLNESEQWNSFIDKLPVEQQDIYFTPEYYSLYQNLGDGIAECFIFEKDGEIALFPYLINSINSLGYKLEKEYFDIQGAYGYNGVVSSCYDKSFIDSYFKTFNQYAKNRRIVVEFTRFHPVLKNHLFSCNHNTISFNRKTVFLNLSNDPLFHFRLFQTSTKKQIKRAQNRYNLTVDVAEKISSSHLSYFLNIYHESMRRINTSDYLYFNEDYFKQILNLKSSVLLTAYSEQNPIAAIIVLKYKNYLHGHLGGTSTEYISMHPFSLLYYQMVNYGVKNGFKILHVGGGNSGDLNDTLLNFKMNFSNTLMDFYTGKSIYDQTVYDQIVKEWSDKYPEKVEMYAKQTLKYRY
jgi:hypothetical protein